MSVRNEHKIVSRLYSIYMYLFIYRIFQEMGVLNVVNNVSALMSDVIATGAMCFMLGSFLTDFAPWVDDIRLAIAPFDWTS